MHDLIPYLLHWSEYIVLSRVQGPFIVPNGFNSYRFLSEYLWGTNIRRSVNDWILYGVLHRTFIIMSRARILRIINISLLLTGIFCLYILFGQDSSVISLKRPIIQPETDHHGRGIYNLNILSIYYTKIIIYSSSNIAFH